VSKTFAAQVGIFPADHSELLLIIDLKGFSFRFVKLDGLPERLF